MQKVENSQNVFLIGALFDYNVSCSYKKYSLSGNSLKLEENSKIYRSTGKQLLDDIAKLISDEHCVDFVFIDNSLLISLSSASEFEEFIFVFDKVIP